MTYLSTAISFQNSSLQEKKNLSLREKKLKPYQSKIFNSSEKGTNFIKICILTYILCFLCKLFINYRIRCCQIFKVFISTSNTDPAFPKCFRSGSRCLECLIKNLNLWFCITLNYFWTADKAFFFSWGKKSKNVKKVVLCYSSILCFDNTLIRIQQLKLKLILS